MELGSAKTEEQADDTSEPVLLMFSGGRDSTLAAVRLHAEGHPVRLVTVTSDHLYGIQQVVARLHELRSVLPPHTEWVHIRQPNVIPGRIAFHSRTCLPCHLAYVSIAGAVLTEIPCRQIAFGYASYQRDWPEQTPLAIERLTSVLARHGIALKLPVYALGSRQEAIDELVKYGLSSSSLEQKCSRQVDNIKLTDAQLKQQIGTWEAAIDSALTGAHSLRLEVLHRSTLLEL